MQDPPVWSRKKMILTAVQITGGVILAGFLLMAVADIDLALMKDQQKVDRMYKYLTLAEYTMREVGKDGTRLDSTEDMIAIQEISDAYAWLNGNTPYHQDEGRYLRLDIFHPDGPFKGPLMYWSGFDRWALISRGPDEEFQTTEFMSDITADNEILINLESELLVRQYDPTNGVLSAGDLIVYGEWGTGIQGR